MSFSFWMILNVLKVSIHRVEDRLAQFIVMLKTLDSNSVIVLIMELCCLNTLANNRKYYLLVCFFVFYKIASRIETRSRSPPVNASF